MNSRGAFTLIEILIVLALFLLFSSIAIPNMGILNGVRESKELREIRIDLLYTRNQAIVASRTLKFKWDYPNNGYSITSLDEKEIIKSYRCEYGIRIIENPKINEFIFSPRGTPSYSDTISIVDSKNQRYHLSVAPATGKITLQKVK